MIQYITDEEGKRSAAIIPIELFEKLTRYPALAKFLELIPEESGKKNDVIIPREVVTICITKGITLHAAWRVYRKLTQQQVADVLGITQGSVSAMEKSQKPRDINLSRLAEV